MTARSGRISAAHAAAAPRAGLGRRTAAFMIDLMFIAMAAIFASYFMFAIVFRISPGGDSESGAWFNFILALLGVAISTLLVPVAYGWVSTASAMQGTPGKSIMMLAVVRATSGEPLSGWFGVLRSTVLWSLLFSGLFLSSLLNISMVLWLVPIVPVVLFAVAFSDHDGRSLHDLFVDTRVIVDPRRAVPPSSRSSV